MSDSGSPSPHEVDGSEFLFRCITTADWWVMEEGRPSSAAFKQPDFSTDMKSIALIPQYTLDRFRPGCGLVEFNYALAKAIGFLAYIEIDPNHPENNAHANVYNHQPIGGKRKAMAQKLIQIITENNGVLVPPTFSV